MKKHGLDKELEKSTQPGDALVSTERRKYKIPTLLYTHAAVAGWLL